MRAHDRRRGTGTYLQDPSRPLKAQPQQPPPQQPPPPPPPDGGRAEEEEAEDVEDAAPVTATVESSFTVSPCPSGQDAGAEDSAMGRFSSKVVPQARQRYS
ncbi:hypothetical protein SVIO_038970 [Streptomyces violaceusniger]|uniref:Uncharacterized protein n=1 Tax=Streptomyces violaceusniger TaxID=68280 RepID=A0A4D4KYL7_STRVO|nr:hypothetical protein SVIO_038970 [Streptomyces violaceusniger]